MLYRKFETIFDGVFNDIPLYRISNVIVDFFGRYIGYYFEAIFSFFGWYYIAILRYFSAFLYTSIISILFDIILLKYRSYHSKKSLIIKGGFNYGTPHHPRIIMEFLLSKSQGFSSNFLKNSVKISNILKFLIIFVKLLNDFGQIT